MKVDFRKVHGGGGIYICSSLESKVCRQMVGLSSITITAQFKYQFAHIFIFIVNLK
jgi:hypothetical protein